MNESRGLRSPTIYHHRATGVKIAPLFRASGFGEIHYAHHFLPQSDRTLRTADRIGDTETNEEVHREQLDNR